tara:strand:+ start:173 stop:385 length:213 start_codon:yes stop_codon:yes gene_type:complete
MYQETKKRIQSHEALLLKVALDFANNDGEIVDRLKEIIKDNDEYMSIGMFENLVEPTLLNDVYKKLNKLI